MKFCVFILGLALASFTFAADKHGDTHAADTTSPEVCMPGADRKCDEHGTHSKAQGKNKDWTHQRLEQVANVLPQPVQDKGRKETPEMVSLSSPKALAKISGSEVKLEWTASQNAKVYHLQVSKDAGFNNRSMYVLNNNSVAETSFQLTGLEPKTRYFWRVAAVNGDMKESFTKSSFTSSTFSTK